MLLKIQVFWDVILLLVVNSYRHLGGLSCLLSLGLSNPRRVRKALRLLKTTVTKAVSKIT